MSGSVDGEHGFQIAPMLDVLFVLLLFFMVSAGSQKHETNLSTQLPGTGVSPTSKIPVQITIDSDGQVTVNGAPFDDLTNHELKDTTARLDGVVKANPEQPVVVTPSRSTAHQRVVDVLNACAKAKVKNLAFGTPAD